MFNWFKKPADEMAVVQPADVPTLKEMDAVAAKMRRERDNADAAALQLVRENRGLRNALREIAAMRTAKPSHAARKMADRADLELARAANERGEG